MRLTPNSTGWNDSWMNVYLTQLLLKLLVQLYLSVSRMHTCRCGNQTVTPPPGNNKTTPTLKMTSFVASFNGSIGCLWDLICIGDSTVGLTDECTIQRSNGWFTRLNEFDAFGPTVESFERCVCHLVWTDASRLFPIWCGKCTTRIDDRANVLRMSLFELNHCDNNMSEYTKQPYPRYHSFYYETIRKLILFCILFHSDLIWRILKFEMSTRWEIYNIHNTLTLYCMNYFAILAEITCYQLVTLCNRGLMHNILAMNTQLSNILLKLLKLWVWNVWNVTAQYFYLTKWFTSTTF